MATFLWGKVYFKDTFAGYLREEPGDRVSFTYDESYLSGGHGPIAYTLPLRAAPHISENGLHPFFDNLVSEGWLEQAQNRIMGKRGAPALKDNIMDVMEKRWNGLFALTGKALSRKR